MSFADHQAEGAALASLELLRTFITALTASGVVSRDEVMILIDSTLHRIERMQITGEQQGPQAIVEQAKAARLHLEMMLQGLAVGAGGPAASDRGS